MTRTLLAALLIASVAPVAGCSKPGRFRVSQVGASAIEIRADGAVIGSGSIGVGRFKGQGTYVLVDAFNPLSVPVDLALEGDLLDAGGNRVGKLNRDSLRVPPGGQRTFALAHHEGVVDQAVSADIRIALVQLAFHPMPLRLADANVYRDGKRVVVAANVVNETDREVLVAVIAAFYDETDRLMKRPFSVIRLPPSMTKPARFVGPDGSRRGYLFIGEQIY